MSDKPIIPIQTIQFPGLPNVYTFSTAIESDEHPGCYYRMVGDKKEWFNPPFELDIEYRTTERHNGKVVYAHKKSLGALVKDATIFFTYSKRFITEVAGLEVNVKGVRMHYTAPCVLITDPETKAIVMAIFPQVQFGQNDDNKFTMWCIGDWTTYSATYTLRYTKE